MTLLSILLFKTLLWDFDLNISSPQNFQVQVRCLWGCSGVKKRWEGIKHKHTTLGVSTHLTKYRQKVFNDDADLVGVSLQHVALTSFHPCVLHRELNVILKLFVMLFGILVNCSCFAHDFFIAFNACFWSALNKLTGISFLLSTGNGGLCFQYTAVVRGRKSDTLSCLVWETELPISAFWRVCLFKLLISAYIEEEWLIFPQVGIA